MSSFRRINRGRWHSYELDGSRVTGVTTLIGKGVPKPNLIDWAARMAGEYTADHLDELVGMRERAAVVDVVKNAHARARNFAAAKGTEIHGYAQRILAGEPVEVPEAVQGYVDAYVAWLEDWEPEALAVEAAVGSRRWWYAGTFDLVARFRNPDMVSLIDVKTGGSGVWPETCLQVAAYRAAEVMLQGGREVPMIPTTAGHALWLADDGTYEFLPLESGPDVFAVFLHVAHVAGFMGRDKDDLIGLPLAAPERAEATA